MKLQIALENLEFFAYHGLYDIEKINGAIFKVDVWIDAEYEDNIDLSKLENLVNYEDAFAVIKAEMEIPRQFIEDLAQSMIAKLEDRFAEKDLMITLKITKPNPAGKFGSGAASVTIQM
jgi:7,8-dihydroneopterin aldolase/epimerase/oxygenase